MSSSASKSDKLEAVLFVDAILLAVVADGFFCVLFEVLFPGPVAACGLSGVGLLVVVLMVDEGEVLTEPSLGGEVDVL